MNISEANARADLLAQEVDDHHAKLEESSQTKLMLVPALLSYRRVISVCNLISIRQSTQYH